MEHPAITEELELLRRILREELFRFVLVEYNHTDAIKQAEDFVRKAYPRRSILELRIEGNNYRHFSKQLKDFKRGIVFIPDFDVFFKPGYEDFSIAFNQRRDWLALQPLALVCFLPAGGMQQVMTGMPDFWSRRDAELNLVVPLPERSGLFLQESRMSTIGGSNATEKTAELQRLRSELAKADPDNFSALDNLYRQLLPLLEDIGDYQAGLEAARRYYHLAAKEEDANGDWASLSYAHTYLARFHKALGQYADADYHYQKALELAEAHGEEYDMATSWNNYGNFLREVGRYAEAKQCLEKALASAEQNFGPDHTKTAVRYSNLALVLKALGDYAGAKGLLEKAMASYEQHLGPDHPTTAACYSNLAMVLRNLGDYAGAKGLLEKAMASYEQNLGPDHSNTATSYSNLALVLQDLGDYTGAKGLLEKSMQAMEKNFGPDHPSTAVSYSNLALLLRNIGDFTGVKKLLEKAVASDEQNFGPDHPSTARSYNNLAWIFHDQGQWPEAEVLFQKAYDIFLKSLGEDHPNTKKVKESLAIVQAKLAGPKT